MHPKELSIQDFSYDLPDNRIARYPLPERDASKLLIYHNRQIQQDQYFNLPEYLPEGAFLIFNNTKVVAARLLFQKMTGSQIELFCLEPDDQYSTVSQAMAEKGKVIWKCLVGGAKKWKEEVLNYETLKDGKSILLQAKKLAKKQDYFLVELSWNDPTLTFADILLIAGLIPLPPYLNRAAEASDENRYQTIYAQTEGSVAAPTAGLHFTQQIFEKLQGRNIHHDFLTLHVGAGTFKPVKSNTMEHHEMHAEWMEVSQVQIDNLLKQLPRLIIAVGTTSLRMLESLYWLGVKIKLQPSVSLDQLQLSQWEAYDMMATNIEVADAFQTLLNWMRNLNLPRLVTRTQIIIAPGYQLKVAGALITNFHQPQSTLLLLVAAIAGADWKNIYEYALTNEFRFLSYGDGCLLFPAHQ